jgi:hypothetical protein
MDIKQTNRVNMFKTVAAYLDRHNLIWSTMAPLAAAVQTFNDKIAAIDAASREQETPSGAAENKAAAREALEDVLFLTCEALGVLSHTSNNHELRALTALSPTAISKLNGEELAGRATTVLSEANARKTELAPLQVTQANLDELTQALDAFGGAKEQPRTAMAERMAQTETLADSIREANGILRDQIDRLVNLFRRTNSEFVAGYRGARVVVDRVARHTPAKPAGSPPPQPPAT